jgi:excisionase family DNA binding protein
VASDSSESNFPKEWAAKLITVTEASRLSRLTPSYIRRLLRNGELEGQKVGEIWLTTEEAIRDYLSRDRHPGPKPKQ